MGTLNSSYNILHIILVYKFLSIIIIVALGII